MRETPKANAAKNRGLQDDHDPSDIGQRTANKSGQGTVMRQRGRTLGEGGADEPFGFEPKPMLNEHHERNLLGGDGLRGSEQKPRRITECGCNTGATRR